MTKNDFLVILEDELRKNGIGDVRDILSEYEEHFSFKIADGYSEEEIAKKLGKPSELAGQYEVSASPENRSSRKIATLIGLFFTDLFAGACFILLWLWEIVMLGLSIAFAAIAVTLLLGLDFHPIIPPMPYWSGAIFGMSFIALSVLTAVGSIYFAVYLRQLMRSFGRFHYNTKATASGRPTLPALPMYPQLPVRKRRLLRRIALISLAAFAICFVLSMITSMLSAKTLEFWHEWKWFGYSA